MTLPFGSLINDWNSRLGRHPGADGSGVYCPVTSGGGFAYTTLPKEGEPDIEIPMLIVSIPFPGISAADSETLLVKPMENELADLDGLKKMTSTAAENYANLVLEFEFGWDKTK